MQKHVIAERLTVAPEQADREPGSSYLTGSHGKHRSDTQTFGYPRSQARAINKFIFDADLSTDSTA